MPQITSLPTDNLGKDSFGGSIENRVGYAQLINQPNRTRQEDALVSSSLSVEALTPAGASCQLSPIEIGYRLWTTGQLLDNPELKNGTTVSMTVYDGKRSFITATVGDSSAFVVVYGKQGNVLGVLRLNTKTHNLKNNPQEVARIESIGGCVTKNRVVSQAGQLALSRALGDDPFKSSGVCADAIIDIITLDQIAEQLKVFSVDDLAQFHIISVCDGFTDCATSQSKEGHEAYLVKVLSGIQNLSSLPEQELAKELVLCAKRDGSKDNISVVVQQANTASLQAVFDGHGGCDASVYAAENLCFVFTSLCTLSPDVYEKLNMSVHNNLESYSRDNVLLDSDLEVAKILEKKIPALQKINESLPDEEQQLPKKRKLKRRDAFSRLQSTECVVDLVIPIEKSKLKRRNAFSRFQPIEFELDSAIPAGKKIRLMSPSSCQLPFFAQPKSGVSSGLSSAIPFAEPEPFFTGKSLTEIVNAPSDSADFLIQLMGLAENILDEETKDIDDIHSYHVPS